MYPVKARCPAIVAMLLLVAVGCSDGAPESSPEAPDPVESAEPTTGTGPGRTKLEWGLIRAIGLQWQQIKQAPDRTGILAEKPKYSLFSEEIIIRDFFQDREGGFFVDVGCAWPTRANNTYYLEKHLGWTGIGIDALQDYAEAWRKERPVSRFFRFLVTDRTAASGTFFKSAGLGLSSVDRENASGTRFGANVEPEEIEVPMITLDDLLDREGVTKVDLLAMDIEGHEATALAGFDIARFRPDLVVAEGKDPAVVRFLAAHGYEWIERYTAHDPVNRYFQPKQGAVAE